MDKVNEINQYIERSVADIARKCHCDQEQVWKSMALHPHFTLQKNPVL